MFSSMWGIDMLMSSLTELKMINKWDHFLVLTVIDKYIWILFPNSILRWNDVKSITQTFLSFRRVFQQFLYFSETLRNDWTLTSCDCFTGFTDETGQDFKFLFPEFCWLFFSVKGLKEAPVSEHDQYTWPERLQTLLKCCSDEFYLHVFKNEKTQNKLFIRKK